MEEIKTRMAEAVQFLSDHRWIYDVQVTRLFSEQWWKTFPDEVQLVSISTMFHVPQFSSDTHQHSLGEPGLEANVTIANHRAN